MIVTSSLLPELLIVRRTEEEALQAAAMAFLDRALPADAIAQHSPGEGKRTPAAQRALKRSGYKAGWPDIEVIHRGRALFIELKAPKGTLSKPQRELQPRLEYCGCPVQLCRSLECVEATLRGWGVPLRARIAA
jgi:hypothetical protein